MGETEVLAVVGISFCLVANVCITLCRARKSGIAGRPWSRVWPSFQAYLRKCLDIPPGQSGSDMARTSFFDSQSTDAWRLTSARYCISWLLLVHNAMAVAFLGTIVVAQLGNLPGLFPAPARGVSVALVALVGERLVVTILHAFPQLLTTKTLGFWYCCGMATLVLFSLSGAAGEGVNYDRYIVAGSYHNLACIAWGAMNLRFSTCLIWNIAQAVATIYSVTALIEFPISDASLSPRLIFMNQLSCLCMKMAILYALESALVSVIRKDREAFHERNHHSALTSLLGIMCDAVVELDAELLIVDHVPALAHMLLYGSGKCLRGRRFDQFMPDPEDRQQLERFVHVQDKAAEAVASMFQARIRDSLGNRIAMEFFHVPFRNSDNLLCHLIGLREYADFKREHTNTELSSTGGLHVIDEADISISSYHSVQSERTSVSRPRTSAEEGRDTSLSSFGLSDTSDAYEKAVARYNDNDDQSYILEPVADHFTNFRAHLDDMVSSLRAQQEQKAQRVQLEVGAAEPHPVLQVSPGFLAAFWDVPAGTRLSEGLPGSGAILPWLTWHARAVHSGSRDPQILEFGCLDILPAGAAAGAGALQAAGGNSSRQHAAPAAALSPGPGPGLPVGRAPLVLVAFPEPWTTQAGGLQRTTWENYSVRLYMEEELMGPAEAPLRAGHAAQQRSKVSL